MKGKVEKVENGVKMVDGNIFSLLKPSSFPLSPLTA
jgi:hypothetical protein